jgi:hypothetical protein
MTILKLNAFLCNFNLMLSVFLTQKLSVCNLIGVENIKNFITNFLNPLALPIKFLALTHTSKMGQLSINIDITGLALLAHASMPLKFWDEAFITATYLINRLPTRVIDNLSPLSCLFNTPPNYSMLKIFCCVCWPHLHLYMKHKLSFRSKPCIFLGYSCLHKGYKCLDQDSSRVYISRDMIFDEAIFPFSNPSSNVADQGNIGTNWNTNQVINLFPASPVCVCRPLGYRRFSC